MARKKRLRKDRLLLVILCILVGCFFINKGYLYVKTKIINRENNKKAERVLQEKKNIEEINQIQNEANKKIIRIIIDPAKGGDFAGRSTPDSMMREKDINLDIARMVRNKLDKYHDVSCMLTRDLDKNKSTEYRVGLADANDIDLFISIRVNAQSGGNQAKGFEIYYSDPSNKRRLSNTDSISQSSRDGSEENERSGIEKKKISTNSSSSTEKKNINTNSSTNEKDAKKDDIKSETNDEKGIGSFNDNNLSKAMARSIQRTALSYVDMSDRGISKKNFDVLYYTRMPSVIVQCGFITNQYDGEILQDEEKRNEIASGIAEGVLCFIDENRENIIANRINYR